MFGSGKLKELESQFVSLKVKFEDAVKEKTDLAQQLSNAKNRIRELEKQLEESDGAAMKEQARKTIVEYESLKELYTRKNKELDESRQQTEESFAIEAANKRDDLSREIRENREENQTFVSDTVKTFAGSYQYYLDQVRSLLDAISSAAQDTGEALFADDPQSIKERFGAKILERLQDNADSFRQGTGDLLLISTEEPDQPGAPETPAAEAPEAPGFAPAQEESDLPDFSGSAESPDMPEESEAPAEPEETEDPEEGARPEAVSSLESSGGDVIVAGDTVSVISEGEDLV